MQFPIFDGEREVGKAEVITEGMTYRIEVVCKPLSNSPERIEVKHDSGELSLGLCIPDGGNMRLVKRISKREMPGVAWRFEVRRSTEPKSEIGQEKGVESIAALRSAHLEADGENVKIVYDSLSSSPTGQ